MVDGVSGVDLLAVLLGPPPDTDFTQGPTWIPRPAPTPLQIFRDEWLRRLSEPVAALCETPCPFGSPSRCLGRFWENLTALGETLGSRGATGIGDAHQPTDRSATGATTG
jgi:hypothetical protein